MPSKKKLEKPEPKPEQVPTTEAKMPHKAWTGMLTFGLISVPVILYTAAREESISFNQLHGACLTKLKQGDMRCVTCDKTVDRSEIVKGYPRGDKFVTVTPEEIEAQKPESAKVMEIVQFVPAADVDPLYFEQGYYLAPDDAGRKGYSILRAALVKQQMVGVAKLVKSSKEQVVFVRPYGDNGLMAHTAYYADEVRPMVFPSLPEPKDAEISLAGQLISALAEEFDPTQFADSYRANLMQLIESKAEGVPVKLPAKARAQAEVLDFTDALQKAVDGARKRKKTA